MRVFAKKTTHSFYFIIMLLIKYKDYFPHINLKKNYTNDKKLFSSFFDDFIAIDVYRVLICFSEFQQKAHIKLKFVNKMLRNFLTKYFGAISFLQLLKK